MEHRITQGQIDELIRRTRSLGVEVDVDAETDALWHAHGGSVATAIGVQGQYQGEVATIVIAVLVRDG